MGRGRLIAFEGIDGAGTTTQARMLARGMQELGLGVHLTCEPSEGPVGKLIRRILTHEARRVDARTLALLFAADRSDHVQHEISPMLERGIHVVSDRYVYSSLAYQSLDLDARWVAQINAAAPEPDLTVYLRVDPAVALLRRRRRGSTEELFEINELQERISSNYNSMFGSSGSAMDPGLDLDLDPEPDPAGSMARSDRIHRDLAGSGGILGEIGRTPRLAVLDGALSADDLSRKIQNLVQKICAAG